MRPRITRSAKEGATSFLDVILILGIFVLLQYLAYAHPVQWDLTSSKEFSLSDLSRKVLGTVKQNLDLWVFVAQGDQQTRDLANEYKMSSSFIQVHFVDPNSQPAKAREFGITSPPPIIVVIYGKDREEVSQPDEGKITNAIVRLVSGKVRTLYFLQGHGEPSADSTDPSGFSSLRDILGEENFTVKTLNLIQSKTIPSDAAAIVIIDPRYPFFPQEMKALGDYMKGGGRIFFLCGVQTSKGAINFLKSLGISPQSDLVTDSTMTILGGGPEFLVANNYGSSPITQPFTKTQVPVTVILPFARSLFTQQVQKGETVSPLVSTTARGEAFPLAVQGKKALINFKKVEQKGVIAVAQTATFQKGGRLVVVGSSYFADNQWLSSYPNNQDFAVNAVSWLCESQDTIAIHPKTQKYPPLVLDQRSALQLGFLSLIALPGFGIVLGISSWLRRKNL